MQESFPLVKLLGRHEGLKDSFDQQIIQFCFRIPDYHRHKVSIMLKSTHVLYNINLSVLQARELTIHVGPDVSHELLGIKCYLEFDPSQSGQIHCQLFSFPPDAGIILQQKIMEPYSVSIP